MTYKLKSVLPNNSIGQKIKQHTQTVYKEVYNADVNPNPDEFIYLEKEGEIYASFGITYRESKKLFSECYLDTSLENIERTSSNIVTSEVGSFISVKNGFGLHLYKMLPYILREKCSFHVLVTLTSKVQTLFNRLNFNTLYLNDAYENRVPVKNIWGSFYKSNPKTFIMDVQKSCSDCSLIDIASRLNIQISEVGRILDKPNLFDMRAMNSFEGVDNFYPKITPPRNQKIISEYIN
ncbi:MAG: hypothetical protein B7Y25_03085 [Alphaproteobacteria bacterium 16-39-46]|nr:MAG: hypothetical protein B7Y25_03085 [Alphaproteobacteria bacterium 16-39-46]OZA43398.1 MAG: hypothetical protein B7X84_03285 [Alphaproteobacteria bacterium 17-39-52]HQS83887.1 thermostable hemolysin [Alphaproteobacteria bacterium]HQS93724.1 thermostable hemolysin [Alphaproteobacteria bacterium]